VYVRTEHRPVVLKTKELNIFLYLEKKNFETTVI